MNQTETSVLQLLLDPIANCLNPEVARRIVDLRAPTEFQERLDRLAEACNEGSLNPEEEAEYQVYIHAIELISLLQAKARSILDEARSR